MRNSRSGDIDEISQSGHIEDIMDQCEDDPRSSRVSQRGKGLGNKFQLFCIQVFWELMFLRYGVFLTILVFAHLLRY